MARLSPSVPSMPGYLWHVNQHLQRIQAGEETITQCCSHLEIGCICRRLYLIPVICYEKRVATIKLCFYVSCGNWPLGCVCRQWEVALTLLEADFGCQVPCLTFCGEFMAFIFQATLAEASTSVWGTQIRGIPISHPLI